VTITDGDAVRIGEGLEVTRRGRGFTPYPETPGPRPRPAGNDTRGRHVEQEREQDEQPPPVTMSGGLRLPPLAARPAPAPAQDDEPAR
jgi:hypothetical protein